MGMTMFRVYFYNGHRLQVLGLLRPARKIRGDFAQKLVFHSGHADMETGSNT